MCKKRKDGTYRYCPGRQPGSRSSVKKTTRSVVRQQVSTLESHLPASGSVRISTFMAPDSMVQAGQEWTDALSEKDRSHLRNYTSTTDAQINNYLRTRRGVLGEDALETQVRHKVYDEDGFETGQSGTMSMAGSVKALDRALESAPRLEEPVVVYRGLHVPDDEDPYEWASGRYLMGSNAVMPQFSSASMDPMTSMGFGGTNPVMLEIVTRQGAYLDAVSEFGMDGASEQEVLLRRNSRFKVVGIEEGEVSGDPDFYDGPPMSALFVRMVEVDEQDAQEAGRKAA